jgi:hypothetical protein
MHFWNAGALVNVLFAEAPAGAPIGNLLRLAALDAMGTKHVLEDLRICAGRMIAPIEAIEIGILPTVASSPLGQAWPRAFAKFRDGLRRVARRSYLR